MTPLSRGRDRAAGGGVLSAPCPQHVGRLEEGAGDVIGGADGWWRFFDGDPERANAERSRRADVAYLGVTYDDAGIQRHPGGRGGFVEHPAVRLAAASTHRGPHSGGQAGNAEPPEGPPGSVEAPPHPRA